MGAPSQFTVYSSGDAGSPVLNGTSGSLLNLLNACLVNGYGSKPGQGWIKPLPDSNNIGCFQQPSGSGMTLFVNDSAWTGSFIPNSQVAGGSTREALVTGYEILFGLTGSLLGSGSGQFPLPGQTINLTPTTGPSISGSLIWRKSLTVDSTVRQWIMFADARTMYLFVKSGDASVVAAAPYLGYFFGDIYSLKPTTDFYKCIIQGRYLGGSFNGAFSNLEQSDMMGAAGNLVQNSSTSAPISFWIVRTATGPAGSVPVIKIGDLGKSNTVAGVNSSITNLYGQINPGNVIFPMAGAIPGVNPVDNSLYMSPISVAESSNGSIRGRMRGMYMLNHPSTMFQDGQVIAGGNEYAGKTFQIVWVGSGGGMWVIETSPTVETNDL